MFISVETCAIPEVAHGKVSQSRLPIGVPVDIRCDLGYYDPYNGEVKCTLAGTISHSNLYCQSKWVLGILPDSCRVFLKLCVC